MHTRCSQSSTNAAARIGERDGGTLDLHGEFPDSFHLEGCVPMNSLGRKLRVAARTCRTHYPGFLFGLPLRRGDIPVFTYHDVESPTLADDLEFLKHNGYRTLGLDEFLNARAAGSRDGRCVLLTFDDARRSFWEVALPLLKAFAMKAVLFAPTYWMAPPEQRAARDDLFMSWEQLRACAASGLVDVQSHAHRHALVPISEQLVGFATPQMLARFDIYDWPLRAMKDGEELGRPPLGTPVYRAEPLLSAPHRYLESSELTELCRQHVERLGGERFFDQPKWLAELRALHRDCSHRMPGQRMQPAAFEQLASSEFEISREQFRRHLGYEPRCIAYPWRLGSEHSLQLARRNGLHAAFGVALDYGAERRATEGMVVFGRLKCDWLRLLPGKRRSSMLATLVRKLSGAGKLQHLAH